MISLGYFQEQLQSIYEIDIVHSVHDFLITDKQLADILSCQDNARDTDESLLIAEHEDGLSLSLYISADVFKQLENAHPINLVHKGKYSEFCLMLEGVSHFLYIIWNADHKKKVTLFEMELQAEVDKFVMLQSLIDNETKHDDVIYLRNWLFEKNGFDDKLNNVELERYKQANFYAGKYCMSRQQKFKLHDLNNNLLNELRRFYRLGQEDKIRYINQLH